jgi:hypothetical protein
MLLKHKMLYASALLTQIQLETGRASYSTAIVNLSIDASPSHQCLRAEGLALFAR